MLLSDSAKLFCNYFYVAARFGRIWRNFSLVVVRLSLDYGAGAVDLLGEDEAHHLV